MAVDPRTIEEWLANDISERALMLHGTSVEALFKLFEDGKLEKGSPYNREVLDPTGDRLYFSPIAENIRGTKLYHDELDRDYMSSGAFTRDDAIMRADIRAETNGFASYLFSRLGFETSELKDLASSVSCADFEGNDQEKVEYIDELYHSISLHRYGYGIARDQLNRWIEEGLKRKGIIIEPNDRILELPCSYNPAAEAIELYCPDGLDASCVRGIRLLGEVEEREVRNYLTGNKGQVGRYEFRSFPVLTSRN